MTLYHGSSKRFKKDDLITPQNFSVAFAHRIPEAVGRFGRHTYAVEPIDPKEAKETTEKSISNPIGVVESTKGFRVIGKHRALSQQQFKG